MTVTAVPERLTVEFTQIVRTEERFDLVEAFRPFSDELRAEYWAMPLDGYQEWERPIAWGFRVFVDAVPHGHVDEDGDAWVIRDGRARSGFWSEEDYNELCVAVPWLAPAEPLSDEDLARTPGPLDVPLDLGPR